MSARVYKYDGEADVCGEAAAEGKKGRSKLIYDTRTPSCVLVLCYFVKLFQFSVGTLVLYKGKKQKEPVGITEYTIFATLLLKVVF